MKSLLLWYFILPASRSVDTQRFPFECYLDNLVDQVHTLEEDLIMVDRVTKKAYEAKERLEANGTGKDRLKVLFQNERAKEKTFEIIKNIDSMLSKTRPHVFFMAECLLK